MLSCRAETYRYARLFRGFAQKLAITRHRAKRTAPMRLTDIAPDVWAAIAALTLGAVAVQSLRLWALRSAPRRRIENARRRGAAGELRAETLFERLGLTVLERQCRASYSIDVDGVAHTVTVRADFIVAAGDNRYVAEVKTGLVAPRIDTPATRRQLLEYSLVFGVDGVLLVEADEDRVHTIDFHSASTPPKTSPHTWSYFILGTLVGASLFALHQHFA